MEQQSKNQNTPSRFPRRGERLDPLPTMEELDELHMDNLISLQDILAEQVALFKRISLDGKWTHETRAMAKTVLDLTESEYWGIDLEIDREHGNKVPF